MAPLRKQKSMYCLEFCIDGPFKKTKEHVLSLCIDGEMKAHVLITKIAEEDQPEYLF